MALSLNDLKRGKAGKASKQETTRRMVRPWEDPTQELSEKVITTAEMNTSLASNTKEVANQEQIGSKKVARQGAKREQKGSKEVADQNPRKRKGVAQTVANREQKGSKEVAEKELFYLVGHERKILQFIFEQCFKEGDLISDPFSKDFLATFLKTSYGTAKSAILRLEKKGFINRHSAKTGRGGWIRFEIPKDVYQILLLNGSNHDLVANREQRGSKQGAQTVASAPSSSSKILDLNKTTTTTENAGDHEKITESLPTDPHWDKIDHSPLKEIGFNASHVAQIQSQGLHTPKTIQDSIYAFYYDLNANSKLREITGTALNYFMGILRRGPYSPPANYESPEDLQLREYLEAKEKLLEKRRAHLERIKALEFEEWADSLSSEEIKTLAPMGSSDTPKRSQLRNHFDEHIWSEKKKQISDKLGQGTESEIVLQYLENTSYPKGMAPPLNPPIIRT